MQRGRASAGDVARRSRVLTLCDGSACCALYAKGAREAAFETAHGSRVTHPGRTFILVVSALRQSGPRTNGASGRAVDHHLTAVRTSPSPAARDLLPVSRPTDIRIAGDGHSPRLDADSTGVGPTRARCVNQLECTRGRRPETPHNRSW
jgi:hypothetical protein